MNFENALVSREVVRIDGDYVIFEETWDLSHPESPWVSTMASPWNALEGEYTRRGVMISEKFWRLNIPLKAPVCERPEKEIDQ